MPYPQVAEILPFVSVCTPTQNRRKFIPAIIQCYLNQTYPSSRMEWIVLDDGTDKVGDLFKNVRGAKYFPMDTKVPIGEKRNLMNKKCKGDIIVYMDDDDYYPPERVSHAVSMLLKHPNVLCAGSSELHFYFRKEKRIFKFGPYGAYHATANTFAFRRDLLQITSFEDTAAFAEECKFLKGYKIPMIQLDSRKTILGMAHSTNTFNKSNLLENKKQFVVSDSTWKIEEVIPSASVRTLYL